MAGAFGRWRYGCGAVGLREDIVGVWEVEEISAWLAWVGHAGRGRVFNEEEVKSAAIGNLAGKVAMGGKAGREGVAKVETGNRFAVPCVGLTLATAVEDGGSTVGAEA